MKNNTKTQITIALGIASAILILIINVIPSDPNKQSRAEQEWNSTEVEIIKIETHGGGTKVAPCSYPAWTYKYSVGGNIYIETNPDIAAGIGYTMCGVERDAKIAAEDRPVGTHLIGYYDPKDPQHSTLDLAVPQIPRENNNENRWWASIGIAFFYMLFLAAFQTPKDKSNQTN